MFAVLLDTCLPTDVVGLVVAFARQRIRTVDGGFEFDPVHLVWQEVDPLVAQRAPFTAGKVVQTEQDVFRISMGRAESKKADRGRDWQPVTHFCPSYVCVRELLWATDEGHLFVLLGESAEVWRFDVATGDVKMCTRLSSLRYRVATAGLGSMVFVTGGKDDALGSLSVVEAFDRTTGERVQKLQPPPMRVPRSEHASVSVRGCLFVLGGEGPSCRSVLRSVEIYDPIVGTWCDGPPMRTPRSRFSALVLEDTTIWVIGGWTGNDWTMCTEGFDCDTQIWLDMPCLPRPLHRRCCVV